jgi:hypothetical protein
VSDPLCCALLLLCLESLFSFSPFLAEFISIRACLLTTSPGLLWSPSRRSREVPRKTAPWSVSLFDKSRMSCTESLGAVSRLSKGNESLSPVWLSNPVLGLIRNLQSCPALCGIWSRLLLFVGVQLSCWCRQSSPSRVSVRVR